MEETIKLVVFVPLTHADIVRKAIGDAGAGKLGNYTHCTFSTKGVGRYLPGENAKPFIGEVGKFEEVEEEKIEAVCYKKDLEKIIKTIKKVHPYEEIALDIYPLINL
jgi:hypothetical protein